MFWKSTFQGVLLLIAVCKADAETVLNQATDSEADRGLLSFNDFAEILGDSAQKPTPPPTLKPTIRPTPHPTHSPTIATLSPTLTGSPSVATESPSSSPSVTASSVPTQSFEPTVTPSLAPTFAFVTAEFRNLEITLFGLRAFPTSQVQNFVVGTNSYIEGYFIENPPSYASDITTRVGLFEINSFPIAGGVIQFRFNQTITFLPNKVLSFEETTSLITDPFATEELQQMYVEALNESLDVRFREFNNATEVTGAALLPPTPSPTLAPTDEDDGERPGFLPERPGLLPDGLLPERPGLLPDVLPGLLPGNNRKLESKETFNLRKQSAGEA